MIISMADAVLRERGRSYMAFRQTDSAEVRIRVQATVIRFRRAHNEVRLFLRPATRAFRPLRSWMRFAMAPIRVPTVCRLGRVP